MHILRSSSLVETYTTIATHDMRFLYEKYYSRHVKVHSFICHLIINKIITHTYTIIFIKLFS